MNIYLVIILAILIFEYAWTLCVEGLNVRHASPELPQEFEGYYDAAKYRQSQNYLKEKVQFSLIQNTFFLIITIIFILIGGFNFVDRIARGFGHGDILTGLIFTGIIMLAAQVLAMPFSVYHTFVVEEKFGFNKTTPKTFILDAVKSLSLGAILGGLLLGAVLWIFGEWGAGAWVYCWLVVVSFQLFLTFISPVAIMPLFFKFTPLEEGELKKSIEDYADSQKFALKGIFTIDGSRRSTKSNAFFAGFGKSKRIALFDTLIKQHTTAELVAILAHEIGHYKKKHILKMTVYSILHTGLMFFILTFFLNNAGLFAAFQMQETSIYAGLFFFTFLYTPINLTFSIISNVLSRRHEYEADYFAVTTYQKPEDMITALKKLAVHNLANLTPHPLKVFTAYSHPPMLDRVQTIREVVRAA